MAKKSMKQKFGGAGGMGGFGMMKQVQQMKEQMVALKESLAEETVTVTAGGGMVTVIATGDQKIQSILIEEEILKDADVEMIQDLILTAVNSALDQSRELVAERLGPLAGGMPF